ncbi:hypothetical protein niasHT_013182 [Heterodera trifolii]|uniref:Uncharacterized protein n=1 Tax=Heterodera trifolii TaxID=157864 RepID=A0ABD2KTX4_9BILA
MDENRIGGEAANGTRRWNFPEAQNDGVVEAPAVGAPPTQPVPGGTPGGRLRPDELNTPIRIWIEVNGNCQVERRLRHTTVVPLEQMREDIEFHYAGFLGVKEFCGVSINCRHDIMHATKITTDLLDEHGDGPSLRYVSLSDAFFSTGPDAQNRRDDQIGDRIRLHVPRVTKFLQKNEHVVGALVELLTNQQGWRLTEEQIAQFFLNNPIVAPTSGTDETDGGTTAEPKKDGPTQKTVDDTDEPKEAKKTDEPKEPKRRTNRRKPKRRTNRRKPKRRMKLMTELWMNRRALPITFKKLHH